VGFGYKKIDRLPANFERLGASGTILLELMEPHRLKSVLPKAHVVQIDLALSYSEGRK
jgi:hypothetical protein